MRARDRRWKRLPKKSRKMCREVIFKKKRVHTYLARCPNRAEWHYGKESYAVRCTYHKEWIDGVVKATGDMMERMLR